MMIVQIIVTLAFLALLVAAARSIAWDLARPLVNYPACAEDARYDAMMSARGSAGSRRAAGARVRMRDARPLPPLAAAA